jgi:hypothetical protein
MVHHLSFLSAHAPSQFSPSISIQGKWNLNFAMSFHYISSSTTSQLKPLIYKIESTYCTISPEFICLCKTVFKIDQVKLKLWNWDFIFCST